MKNSIDSFGTTDLSINEMKAINGGCIVLLVGAIIGLVGAVASLIDYVKTHYS